LIEAPFNGSQSPAAGIAIPSSNMNRWQTFLLNWHGSNQSALNQP